MASFKVVCEKPLVHAVLALVLASYAGYAAPSLSPKVTKVVTSDWFRFIVVFLVAFMPRKHFRFAFFIAIAFVVTSNVLLKYHVLESFENGGDEEDFGNRDEEDFGNRDEEDFGNRDEEDFTNRDEEDFGNRDEEDFGNRDEDE
jgi:hypothetical protein